MKIGKGWGKFRIKESWKIEETKEKRNSTRAGIEFFTEPLIAKIL